MKRIDLDQRHGGSYRWVLPDEEVRPRSKLWLLGLNALALTLFCLILGSVTAYGILSWQKFDLHKLSKNETFVEQIIEFNDQTLELVRLLRDINTARNAEKARVVLANMINRSTQFRQNFPQYDEAVRIYQQRLGVALAYTHHPTLDPDQVILNLIDAREQFLRVYTESRRSRA